ncbi:MAG TPA: response regulator [Chloroflexota bacterium]|nr:response regulator [Chloroflexota bacterium]
MAGEQAPVVIVEDELDVLDVLREALEYEGYRVMPFTHPDQVHATAAAIDPAAFLIDIMLPRLSGIELAEALRRERFPRTPMIALSASALMLDLARQSGLFNDCIAKPFDIEELVRTLGRLSQKV